jgi:hypothetical protein
MTIPNGPNPQAVAAAHRALVLSTLTSRLKLFWYSIRSNKYFVAFEGGVTGALGNYIDDLVATGHRPDFSKTGFEKLGFFMLSGGYTAVKLLYRPQPTPTVVAVVGDKVEDVPATLKPQDSQAVAASTQATGAKSNEQL